MNPSPDKQTIRKRRLKTAVITLLSFIVFLLLLDNVIMPLYVGKGKVGYIPDIVGKQVDEAVKKLEDAGFEPIIYERQFDEKIKEGIVLRQSPDGDAEAKPGRKIYLIVSAGQEIVVMPKVAGMSLDQARIELVRLNLGNIATEFDFYDSIPSGIVVSQSPPAGTKYMPQKKVSLVVSQGARSGKVVVPDVTGLRYEEAVMRLQRIYLTLGKANFESRAEGKPMSVYDQYPAMGEVVEKGTPIDLFIVKDNNVNPEVQEGGQ
jgi:serine/threonine-protein kinase